MSHDHPPTPDPEDDPSPQNSAESTANPEPEAAGDAAAEDVVSGTNHPLSDSCPAANTPRPSPSGTSDKVIDNYFDNLQDTERDGEVYKVCRRQKLSDVPDVPDDGENTPPNLPDGCRTRVGRHVVSGVVRVGPMRAERRTFQNLECPELEMLLTGEAPLDTVIERAKGSSAEITFLDGDTHRWQSPPSTKNFRPTSLRCTLTVRRVGFPMGGVLRWRTLGRTTRNVPLRRHSHCRRALVSKSSPTHGTRIQSAATIQGPRVGLSNFLTRTQPQNLRFRRWAD